MTRPTFSQELAVFIEDEFLRDETLEAITAKDIARGLSKTKSNPRPSFVRDIQLSLPKARVILEASENKMLVHLVSEDYFELCAGKDPDELSEHELRCCIPGNGRRSAVGIRRVLTQDDPVFVEWLHTNRRTMDGHKESQVSRIAEGYDLGLITEEQTIHQIRAVDSPSSARQERHELESAKLRAISHEPRRHDGQEYYDRHIRPFLKDNKGRLLYPPKDMSEAAD